MTLKKSFLFVTAFFMCVALNAENHGICGDSIEWTLTDGILTFYGSGQMQDFKGYRPWRERKIKTVVINQGITNIGKRVFEDCVNLKQISIPNSVKTIGDSAFYDCDNLRKIVIPNSVTKIGNGCFASCERLDSIVLSDSLQYIGEKAFYECNSLTNIIIPNSVQYVGSKSFQKCNNLTILIVPDSPFEVGKDTTLGLANCHSLSIVRAHHSLCPGYILKYIPSNCPFMRAGNPRRYYGGSITKGNTIIVPAIKTYTLQEAIDTVDHIFQKHFSISNPCTSYYLTKEMLARFITILEVPMYKDLLQYYYYKFYEAGSNNKLDDANVFALKHLMLGGTDDVELMWNIIIKKYGNKNETNNTRFLMSQFKEFSSMRNNAYQQTIDSLTTVYYDVLYPKSFRDMCGYWVSINDTTQEGDLTDAPNYIINIADVTCPNGTTILSSPKCKWSSKKKKNQWQNKTYDNSQLRYSHETKYNQETKTVQLLFNSQNKKIANTKLQHQALDMVQNFKATMSASLEQIQKELNRGLANNWISFSNWGTNTAIASGIDIGVHVVAAVVVFAILYAANIETAQRYEIILTQKASNVLDVSIRYAYARHNYNNGKTKQKEEIQKFTFIKWEETDSIVFISNSGKPIFIGETFPTNSPLLDEYNTNKKKATYQKINKASISKLIEKADGMLRMKERKKTSGAEQSDEEKSNEELFF